MPASNERIPNKSLSGVELRQIILKDVENILSKDGMLSNNIAFGRISYEVRVSLHLDNPFWPEHISTTLSKAASVQELAKDPALGALEPGLALDGDLSDDAMVSSTETHREVKSPNVARIENDMPIPTGKVVPYNNETGEGGYEKTIQYEGNKPDPVAVGNKLETRDTSEDQAARVAKAREQLTKVKKK